MLGFVYQYGLNVNSVLPVSCFAEYNLIALTYIFWSYHDMRFSLCRYLVGFSQQQVLCFVNVFVDFSYLPTSIKEALRLIH